MKELFFPLSADNLHRAIRPRVSRYIYTRRKAIGLFLTFVCCIIVMLCPRGLAQDLGTSLLKENANKHHVNLTGKPCLTMEGYATAQRINKNIFEHWIRASNSCGQNIRVRVCYSKTTDCISMNIPAWESKNAVLGIYPSIKDFKFDSEEQF